MWLWERSIGQPTKTGSWAPWPIGTLQNASGDQGKIFRRRRKLRLAPFRPYGRLWHRAEEELLGTMPDRKLARRLKRSVLSVASRRRARHIPIFHPKKHRWTPADDKLLSERPDAQVAMLLGISRLAAKHRRLRLGIVRPGRDMFVPIPGSPRRMPCWARPRTGSWPAGWGAAFPAYAREEFNWVAKLPAATGLQKPMRCWGRCRTRPWPSAWVARSEP